VHRVAHGVGRTHLLLANSGEKAFRDRMKSGCGKRCEGTPWEGIHRYNEVSEGEAGRELDPPVSTKLRPSQARPHLVERLNPYAGRRLTLVSAPAGVGSKMSRDFAQGDVFVDLSLISDVSRVPAALARGAGLQGVESSRLPERHSAYLRERQPLVNVALPSFSGRAPRDWPLPSTPRPRG
jgi:hypothetical protein